MSWSNTLGRAAAALAVLGGVAGCSKPNPIVPGAYVARTGPHTGDRVEVDASKREVLFTLRGTAPEKRVATAWPSERWPNLCPRGMTATPSEVLDLGPSPLRLGSTTLAHPVVVADCLGKPKVQLRSVETGGELSPWSADLEFDR